MTPCILWRGAVTDRGYGTTTVAGRTVYVHRLAYEAEHGPIPDGLTIDHLCRVKTCINPAHMEPVTRAENSRRGAVRQSRDKTGRYVARRPAALAA